jgi:hypothetical protein
VAAQRVERPAVIRANQPGVDAGNERIANDNIVGGVAGRVART